MNAIMIQNLKKNYGSFEVSLPRLDLRQGYVTGLVGKNGLRQNHPDPVGAGGDPQDSGDSPGAGRGTSLLTRRSGNRWAL